MVKLKRILLPTDFSDFSEYAGTFAISFACDYGARLYVLHVVETFHDLYGTISMKMSNEELNAKVVELVTQEIKSASTSEMFDELDYEVSCVKGKPFLEIVKFAREKEIDMVVMGTHGRSAIEAAVMGSTA